MHAARSSGKSAAGRAARCTLLALAAAVAPRLWAHDPASSDERWGKVSVQLPASTRLFPAGEGADIANAQCLICHSASMVLTQPPMAPAQWQAIINKMRTVYGAPLPADQVDALSVYLSRLVPRD